MEYLVIGLTFVTLFFVYLWGNNRGKVADALESAKRQAAYATVQKARADGAMKVLKEWGHDIDELESQLSAGKTPAQIKADLRSRFGKPRPVPTGVPDKDGEGGGPGPG